MFKVSRGPEVVTVTQFERFGGTPVPGVLERVTSKQSSTPEAEPNSQPKFETHNLNLAEMAEKSPNSVPGSQDFKSHKLCL